MNQYEILIFFELCYSKTELPSTVQMKFSYNYTGNDLDRRCITFDE